MFVLNLLGGAALHGRNGPVTGKAAHKRRVALLAILALARGRTVARERIVGLLWPEHPGDAARHLLSESLYVLRKELGENAFVSAGDEVGLNGEVVAADVEAFERCVQEGDLDGAAEVYRGPLLDGFFVGDAPEFEAWAESERERLKRAHTRVLECLALDREGRGLPAEAADWWRRLAVADPYNSRVGTRLMAALDAAGERAAAIWFAETHVALLRDELGVEPEPEFAAMVERLRSEPVRVPPAPPPRAPVAAARPKASTDESDAPDRSTVAADARDSADLKAPAVSVDSADSLVSTVTPGSAGSTDTASSTDSADAAPSADPLPAREAGIAQVSSADSFAEIRSEAEAGVPAEGDAAPSIAEAAGVAGDERGRTPRSRFGRRGAWLAGAAAVGVLAVAGAALVPRGRRTPVPPPAAAAAAPVYDPNRVAVLYFDDHSRGGELGYLADGLTESLIHALAQVDALQVISRNGVKPFRDGPVRFDSLVAELRVGSVVEGSVQRSGDSVRVTVQLVDGNTMAHLESRTLVHPMTDVFALEDALADDVSRFLRRRLGREIELRRTRAETRSVAAWREVMQAEQAREDAARLQRTGEPVDAGEVDRRLGVADSLLAAAERHDPAWTRPTVLRGWVAHRRARLAAAAAGAALSDAGLAYADSALARAPGGPRARALRGTVLLARAVSAEDAAGGAGLVERAERDLSAAVAAEPRLASAWSTLSQVLRYRGRFAESDAAARRALEEDAYLDDADDVLQRLYFGALMTGDYAQAGALCGEGRRRFRGDWRFVECRLTLLREDRGAVPDPALALRLLAELDSVDPPARARREGRGYSPLYRKAVAAAILARAGRADAARGLLARAEHDAGRDDGLRLSLAYDEAYARLLLGERDSARALLGRTLARRPELRPFAARDPLLRDLLGPASGGATGTRPAAGAPPTRPPS